MIKHKNLSLTIVNNRQKAILGLIKEGKDLHKIEREVALLALDMLEALGTKALSLEEGTKNFLKIEYALRLDMEYKLSEEFRDLLNEVLLLDEIGTPYGPDLMLIRTLATKILKSDEGSGRLEQRNPLSSLKARQKVLVGS